MSDPVRRLKPIFSLRGHDSGVTALEYCSLPNVSLSYLISGDEEGNLIIWNPATFKKVSVFKNIASSTIQSIKNVTLIVSEEEIVVLVVQSRNDGVQVLEFYEPIEGTIKSDPNILASFPTYDALFSRGDAKSITNQRAILAHPSLLENYLVTVRVLGRDAKTEISGTAGREIDESEKKSPIFDIAIRRDVQEEEDSYLVFVAYEDGCLNIYRFQMGATQRVPVLRSEGLNVGLIKRIDLNFKDFVSAYGVAQPEGDGGDYLIVAGSAGRDLRFVKCKAKFDGEPEMLTLKQKGWGVSAVSMRFDGRLFAIACWDKSVSLYCAENLSLRDTLDHHTKQVQAILFAPKLLADFDQQGGESLMYCASQDGTISISSIY